jgi:hypothetical protein
MPDSHRSVCDGWTKTEKGVGFSWYESRYETMKMWGLEHHPKGLRYHGIGESWMKTLGKALEILTLKS